MSNPTDRAQVIAGLRALADLAERIPNLPLPRYFTNPLPLDDDAVANETLDQIEDALADAGLAYTTRRTDDHGREVALKVSGVSYRVYHVWDRVMADYNARQSYAPNVKVDEPAGAVA